MFLQYSLTYEQFSRNLPIVDFSLVVQYRCGMNYYTSNSRGLCDICQWSRNMKCQNTFLLIFLYFWMEINFDSIKLKMILSEINKSILFCFVFLFNPNNAVLRHLILNLLISHYILTLKTYLIYRFWLFHAENLLPSVSKTTRPPANFWHLG